MNNGRMSFKKLLKGIVLSQLLFAAPTFADRLSAIGIGVADLEVSSEFYQYILGLKVLRIYELGYLLQTPARPEGYPVIPPIALLLNTMDQKRTVGSLAEEVASTLKLDAVITEQLVLVAIRNLAADGLIEL